MQKFITPLIAAAAIVGTVTTADAKTILPDTVFTLYETDSSSFPFFQINGTAEVGEVETGIGKAMAEFSLADPRKFAQKRLYVEIGLFGSDIWGFPDDPYFGQIAVQAYEGNGLPDNAGFTAIGPPIGVFDTTGASVGDEFGFDITRIYDRALDMNLTHLGVRFERLDGREGEFVTFDNLKVEVVPLPLSLPLMASGLGALMLLRRRKTAERA